MGNFLAFLMGVAMFFALLFLADHDNPCSQFGEHPERCSQRN